MNRAEQPTRQYCDDGSAPWRLDAAENRLDIWGQNKSICKFLVAQESPTSLTTAFCIKGTHYMIIVRFLTILAGNRSSDRDTESHLIGVTLPSVLPMNLAPNKRNLAEKYAAEVWEEICVPGLY